MVKHVAIWKIRDELTPQQREVLSLKLKNGLEALLGQIDGLEHIKVYINMLDGSSGDIILESVHRDEEALIAYRNHPKHIEAAEAFVRPVAKDRVSADFEV